MRKSVLALVMICATSAAHAQSYWEDTKQFMQDRSDDVQKTAKSAQDNNPFSDQNQQQNQGGGPGQVALHPNLPENPNSR